MRLISNAVNFWNLAKKVYINERPSYRRKQQWKSLYYALINGRSTQYWMQILQASEMKNVTPHRPKMFLKPFRVYISTRWNVVQRTKAIIESYQFIKECGGSGWQDFMSKKEGLSLFTHLIDDETCTVLHLLYDHRYRKEGEFVLALRIKGVAHDIVAIAFSFEKNSSRNWQCLVGCVQGHELSEDSISKTIQKKMQGLRPKSFIVLMLQELCKEMGVAKIFATGDAIQAYRKKHAIHIQRFHKISFDYDAFWSESGGTPLPNGWFELPLRTVRKPIEDIKSSKRAQYNRRYQLTDTYYELMAAAVRKKLLIQTALLEN